MSNKYGVLLDKSVIINYCLGNLEDSPYMKQNSEFINFLKKHPRPLIGIVTLRTRYDVKRQLTEKLRYRGGRSVRMQKFDELRDFAIFNSVDANEFNENLLRVENFFNNLTRKDQLNNINLNLVSPRFRSVIKNVSFNYSEKIFFEKPEKEDEELLAETVCLSKKYKPLFLASLDGHFSGDFASEEIRKAFGINSGFPQRILPQIKEYEKHLFKVKPIS